MTMPMTIAAPWITSAFQTVRIVWTVDGSSGCTECEAWRLQHEIERLESAEYYIVTVCPAV